ncbi:MAG TPA: hypothetical protein VH590_03240 [Ktedonobacterales bacterium]|jgi:hypothetical protein
MVSTRRAPRRSAPARCERCALLPLALLSEAFQLLLMDVLAGCALRWQEYDLPFVPFFWGDSEPLWGEAGQRRCPGTVLRQMRMHGLRLLLGMELERALRLLLVTWTPEDRTPDGHTSLERQEALAGTLGRVAQVCRELTRRRGEEWAMQVARELLEALAFCASQQAA